MEVQRDDARGLVTLALDTPNVLPGVALPSGDHTGDVLYDFGPSGLRCRYYTEARARLRGSLERLIRWVTRDSLYLGQYTCQVMAQAGDGSLDLLPDDARLRAEGLQSVPIRHGLPGVTVEVPAGERVLLSFDGGDPSKPYAALWHAGQATRIVFSYGTVEAAGTQALALAQQTQAALDNLRTQHNAHVHATAALGAPSIPTVPMTPLGGDLATSKLKGA